MAGGQRRACVRAAGGGSQPRGDRTHRAGIADSLATPAIAIAYVVSVALYLRILAQYALGTFSVSSDTWERAIVTALVAAIAAIGITRGFAGLDRMERVALAATLIIVVVLISSLAWYDAGHLQEVLGARPTWRPPAPSLTELATLGGLLITVQGFETVRFLGNEYHRDVRIAASRWSQAITSLVYVLLTLVAGPLLIVRHVDPAGQALLELIRGTLPLLAIPLVITAVGSQLSAAIADVVAAVDGSHDLHWVPLSRELLYGLLAAAVVALAWTTNTYGLVALASRAFALYYSLTSIAAAATAPSLRGRAGHGFMAAALAAIVVFARPAG